MGSGSRALFRDAGDALGGDHTALMKILHQHQIAAEGVQVRRCSPLCTLIQNEIMELTPCEALA